MKRGIQGILTKITVGEEIYNTYFPNPLPPKINYSEIALLLEKANKSIGELNGVVSAIPDPSIINYMYVRKEAVLSSQIEGTQSTLDDLLKYESEQVSGAPIDDVEEVSSYVSALNYGLERIQSLPLSLRLIREIHKVLLQNSRGKNKTPGEFRTSQNWIGGTRPGNAKFVPVNPQNMMDALSALEKFMNDDEDNMPTLVKIALIHHQFETIHCFLDGNGRIGRLLITFFLCVKGFLKSPYLYLSLFFKKNRNLYYQYLNDVRYEGDWEEWIKFFLEGIIETANDARQTLLKIQSLFVKDRQKVSSLAKAGVSALAVFNQFNQKPILSIAELVKKTALSKPTAIKSVKHLIDLGIVFPISEKKWGQLYSYKGYIDLLRNDDTEF